MRSVHRPATSSDACRSKYVADSVVARRHMTGTTTGSTPIAPRAVGDRVSVPRPRGAAIVACRQGNHVTAGGRHDLDSRRRGECDRSPFGRPCRLVSMVCERCQQRSSDTPATHKPLPPLWKRRPDPQWVTRKARCCTAHAKLPASIDMDSSSQPPQMNHRRNTCSRWPPAATHFSAAFGGSTFQMFASVCCAP
jgi:hypothetical protein